MQRRLDAINGLLWFAGVSQDARTRQKAIEVLEMEGRLLDEESAVLKAMLEAYPKKKETSMKTRIAVLVLSLSLVVGGGAAIAQDELVTNTPIAPTEEVTPPVVGIEGPVVIEEPAAPDDGRLIELVERVAPWLSVIMVTFLVIIGVLGHDLITGLVKSAPVSIREAGISAGYSLLGSAEERARLTETPLDDAAIAELRKVFEQLVAAIREQPPAPPEDNTPGLVG